MVGGFGGLRVIARGSEVVGWGMELMDRCIITCEVGDTCVHSRVADVHSSEPGLYFLRHLFERLSHCRHCIKLFCVASNRICNDGATDDLGEEATGCVFTRVQFETNFLVLHLLIF